MSHPKLHVWTRENIRLQDALSGFAGVTSQATVLLSDPHAYRIGILEPNAVRGTADSVHDLSHVFEARAVHDEGELRWRQDAASPGRLGRACILSERDDLRLETEWVRATPIAAIDRMACTYLLAGGQYAPATDADGWLTSSDLRVAAITVPAAAQGPCRLQLVGYEYVALDANHGNAFVAAERLCRIEAVIPSRRTR